MMMDGISGVVRCFGDLLNIFTQCFERTGKQKCMGFSESKKAKLVEVEKRKMNGFASFK